MLDPLHIVSIWLLHFRTEEQLATTADIGQHLHGLELFENSLADYSSFCGSSLRLSSVEISEAKQLPNLCPRSRRGIIAPVRTSDASGLFLLKGVDAINNH